MTIEYDKPGDDYIDKVRDMNKRLEAIEELTSMYREDYNMGNAPVQLELWPPEEVTILDLYQEFTPTTAIYPGAGTGTLMPVMYCALGLSDEAGEVAGKVKKWCRDGTIDKDAVSKELGDVLWYLSQTANELGLSLKSILLQNRDKLIDRQNRDVIGGSGDER